MFVVIEGLDAAGKATQSKLLCDRFIRNGRVAKLFSFPRYDTPIGQVIKAHLKNDVALMRRFYLAAGTRVLAPGRLAVSMEDDWQPDVADPLMFQCLALADKYDAAAEIRSALAVGADVVCDRWTPSSLCYGGADGLDPGWLARMHASLPEADLNIFLDVSAEEALKRRPEARDRYERDRVKQVRVRDNYTTLWARWDGSPRWKVVDGLGAQEEVAERVWKAVIASVFGSPSLKGV